jgi:hypothetical protein
MEASEQLSHVARTSLQLLRNSITVQPKGINGRVHRRLDTASQGKKDFLWVT